MSGYFLVDIVSSLTLQEAENILDGARAAAREADLLPLTIAVLDSGGNIVALKREDGCGTARSAVALGKAHGALGMGVSSRELRDRLKDRPAFQGAIAAATGGQFIAVPGGVLILNADGKAIGAVGISGDASDRDEYAAIAGIQAAGLRAHPDSPAENWKSAGL
ncbi:heme-binding protein [Alphaproteobacteria bacterium HT1-32]|nr:heme-binding protein [Alphaproteobacteria bacterium HT1-32]